LKKVLAFFGAFNPPTKAHLELAHSAMLESGREGVVFVPSKSRYIRTQQGKDFAFSEETRLEMLNSAAHSRDWMRVSDWEIRLSEQARTYRTLVHLREEGYEPALLMGSDKLPELETGWWHVDGIASEFGIVCMARGEDDVEGMLANDPFLRKIAPFIQVIRTPDSHRLVSSTLVRRRIFEIARLIKEAEKMTYTEILSLAIRDMHLEDAQNDS